MGDERLEREEDERYRKVDLVIDKAEADRPDSHEDDQDGERQDSRPDGSDG